MDPPLSPPAARTRAKAAQAKSPSATPPHRLATPRAISRAKPKLNENVCNTLRDHDNDDNPDDDNPFLDSEEEDKDKLSPELLTPPDATAGGVAAVDGAVDEAIDGGAPPGATFATTTAGIAPTARAGMTTVGAGFATAGVDATVDVDGDAITSAAAGVDTTINDDDISATAAGVGVDATVDVDNDYISALATADTLSPAITATIVSTVNKAVTAAVTAAIEASLGDAIVVAIRSVRAEIASNHGHVTKRLFPKLDDKITTLASTVESKGESLLTKITSVDTLVGGRINSIEGRLATLESKLETTMKSTQGAATSSKPGDSHRSRVTSRML